MSYTYDFTTDPLLSQVRLLIPDTSAPFVFTDAEINQFIWLESSQALYVSGQAVPNASSINTTPQTYSVRRSAALALDVISSRLAQQSALEQLLDVKLAAATAAKEARERAKGLREQDAELGNFSIAEMVNTQFAARERVYAQLLRIEGN